MSANLVGCPECGSENYISDGRKGDHWSVIVFICIICQNTFEETVENLSYEG